MPIVEPGHVIELIERCPWRVSLRGLDGQGPTLHVDLRRDDDVVEHGVLFHQVQHLRLDPGNAPYVLRVARAEQWTVTSTDGRLHIVASNATRGFERRPSGEGAPWRYDDCAAVQSADPRVRDAMQLALMIALTRRGMDRSVAPPAAFDLPYFLHCVKSLFEDQGGEVVRMVLDGRAGELDWLPG